MVIALIFASSARPTGDSRHCPTRHHDARRVWFSFFIFRDPCGLCVTPISIILVSLDKPAHRHRICDDIKKRKPANCLISGLFLCLLIFVLGTAKFNNKFFDVLHGPHPRSFGYQYSGGVFARFHAIQETGTANRNNWWCRLPRNSHYLIEAQETRLR